MVRARARLNAAVPSTHSADVSACVCTLHSCPPALSLRVRGLNFPVDYLPDDDTGLRQCFLALDKERLGYVDASTMSMLLTTKGTPLRPKELESFMKVAKCPDTGRIYYDDYIAQMTADMI